MSNRKQPLFPSFFACVLVLIFELVVLQIIVTGGFSFLFYPPVHMAICGVVFLNLGKERDNRFTMTSLLLMFFMGPFGAALSLLMMVFHLIIQRRQSSWGHLLEELFPEEEASRSLNLLQRVLVGWENSSAYDFKQSYYDVIRFGSVHQKRAAIEKMILHFRPEFLPILHETLNDSVNAIRVQGASALRALEDRLEETYDDLFRKVELHPDNVLMLLSFANHCKALAESKMFSSEKESQFRLEAKEAYRNYLAKVGQDQSAIETLIRLYLQDGELEEVHEVLTHQEGLHVLNMEYCYLEKNYKKVRDLAKKASSDSVFEKEIIQTWVGA